MQFTACYTKLENGYMGKLLEWPTVITEGDSLDDCRDLLLEAASEMAVMYKEEGMKIPYPSLIIESVHVPIEEGAILAHVS